MQSARPADAGLECRGGVKRVLHSLRVACSLGIHFQQIWDQAFVARGQYTEHVHDARQRTHGIGSAAEPEEIYVIAVFVCVH